MNRILALTLALGLLLPLTGWANATLPERSQAWWSKVTDQTIKNLQSENMSIREQGLKNVIYFAKTHASDVALDGTVQPLIAIYESARRPVTRRLVLAALESINCQWAQSYVNGRVSMARRVQSRKRSQTCSLNTLPPASSKSAGRAQARKRARRSVETERLAR